jgi:hypothetical protein
MKYVSGACLAKCFEHTRGRELFVPPVNCIGRQTKQADRLDYLRYVRYSSQYFVQLTSIINDNNATDIINYPSIF